MERVAFLIEESNERISCLLNPEDVVWRRRSGVVTRRSASGILTGKALTDDPLLFTGGGRTELDLNLLFDVTLAGSTITGDDVRALTGPLWNLTENNEQNRQNGPLQRVRFLWGKHWDVPGIIVAVSERLEYFTAEGAPRRSWLRLRLVRVNDDALAADIAAGRMAGGSGNDALALGDLPDDLGSAGAEWDIHETIGGGAGEGGSSGERLDQLSDDYYGDASLWRLIAKANDIDNPTDVASGSILRIPPLSVLGGE